MDKKVEGKRLEANNLVYILDGKIYINLTNGCTNDCIFCIRKLKSDVDGANLFLASEEVRAEDVIKQLRVHEDKIGRGVTFCGYGEPTLKLDILKLVAEYIKGNYEGVKIKVNTNGHANLIYKRNVVPELEGLIDEFSVSLNAEDEQKYKELSKPKIEGAYEGLKEFAREGVKSGIKVVMTVVTGYKGYEIDTKECKKVAESIGAEFRSREWLDKGY